ncbi:hypothetical protein [Sphingobacterium griseoflavum]|uniref:Uncharacterized protein n=1 Tax=Sphingobacterium griseoflavum TaxID=1474952 RepID=A0ABQ3HU66_9SPHI|nr:hypothetical protein [Sphingobacterium griseoflavum]GHE35088.1 hypothetical protein GCM10017764_17890 [Sphingobacterium griseoflavum]
MKQIIKFNGKDVEIELTADQIALAKKKSVSYADIKTLQDALDYTGESLESFNNRTQFDDDVQRAQKELEVIVLAVREGNQLGHNEGDRWYYPWFNSARSSAGFSFRVFVCAYSGSRVGSRLCVENSEKATYLGKQFLDTYNRYINGQDLKENIVELPFPIKKPKKFDSFKDIKTFEDACDSQGIDPKAFAEARKSLSADTYAYEQLKVISKALNGGEHMDYTDEDVYKYYPWFNSVGSSAGFSFDDFGCDASASFVGSRLVYPTREIAKYVGQTHIDIYRDLMVID